MSSNTLPGFTLPPECDESYELDPCTIRSAEDGWWAKGHLDKADFCRAMLEQKGDKVAPHQVAHTWMHNHGDDEWGLGARVDDTSEPVTFCWHRECRDDVGCEREPIEDMPRLSMRPQFARWVVAGTKKSTLRSKRMATGRYKMLVGGKPFATVWVRCAGEPIYWTKLGEQGQRRLAEYEGFASVADFEAALRALKIHGNFWLRPFLDGTKPMYLHMLSNPELVNE